MARRLSITARHRCITITPPESTITMIAPIMAVITITTVIMAIAAIKAIISVATGTMAGKVMVDTDTAVVMDAVITD